MTNLMPLFASRVLWGLGSVQEPELAAVCPFWAQVCVSAHGSLGAFCLLTHSLAIQCQAFVKIQRLKDRGLQGKDGRTELWP